ncbi:membrane protein [Microbacterium phage Zayuliv]|nr:membrane protein [Microbacterium phage Zayuliv]
MNPFELLLLILGWFGVALVTLGGLIILFAVVVLGTQAVAKEIRKRK